MALIQPEIGSSWALPLQQYRRWARSGWLRWPAFGLCLLAAIALVGDVTESLLRQFGDPDPVADRQALLFILAITLPIGAWEAAYRDAPPALRLRQMLGCLAVIAAATLFVTALNPAGGWSVASLLVQLQTIAS